MKKKPIITGMLIVLLLTSAACERVKAMDTSYEIQTVGTPDRNEAGEIIGDCHYQKLVFTNTNKNLSKINAYIEQACNTFFANGSGKDYQDYLAEVPAERLGELVDYPYKSTEDIENVFLTDSYVSIQMKSFWYCGGVANTNYSGASYDLKTGEPFKISDLLSGSEEDILSTVKSVYWSALVDHYTYAGMFDSARDALEKKTLSDYHFFVGEAGEIFSIADTYEFAPGAAGPYVFGSGLMVGDTCDGNS